MSMLTEHSPSDFFQIIDGPAALPGNCSTCGYSGGEDRQFVDLRRDIDFYGAVIMCTQCVVNIANLLGFASPEQVGWLEGELAADHTELIKLRAAVGDLEKAIGSLGAYRNGITSGSGASVSIVDDSQPNKPDTGTESHAVELSVEQGLTDVLGTTDDDGTDEFGL